jgi:hypothetical protein
MKEECCTCNSKCCYYKEIEKTTIWALMASHGQGVHWCKKCKDGYREKPRQPERDRIN